MRDCPTIDGSSIPLIIHRIAAGDCLARQSCNYHKCHRCIYRGKPANWVQPDHGVVAAAPATAERAVPTRAVELPRPDVATTAARKAGEKSKAKAKEPKAPAKAAAPVAAVAKTAGGKSKRQASPA